MKNIKTLIIAISLVMFGFILGACGTTTIAEQENPLKIWFENRNGKIETYCLVDESTGVNYIVISGELYESGLGTAITPRLNPNGTLYVTK